MQTGACFGDPAGKADRICIEKCFCPGSSRSLDRSCSGCSETLPLLRVQVSLRPFILKGSTAGDMEGRNPGEERVLESLCGHFNTLMGLGRFPFLAS